MEPRDRPPPDSTDRWLHSSSAKVYDHFGTHSYGWTLVLIVITFAVSAATPQTSWAALLKIVIQAVTLLSVLWTSRPHIWVWRLALVIVAVGLIASIVDLAEGTEVSRGFVLLVGGVLVALAPWSIAKGVIAQGEVNAQSIYGVLSIYLLIGLFFAFIFDGIGAIDSGPFFSDGTDGTSNDYLYFSFATLTTTGFGDFAAATDLGRTASVVEALMGQLYLVTVVALVISRFGARPQAGSSAPAEDGDLPA